MGVSQHENQADFQRAITLWLSIYFIQTWNANPKPIDLPSCKGIGLRVLQHENEAPL